MNSATVFLDTTGTRKPMDLSHAFNPSTDTLLRMGLIRAVISSLLSPMKVPCSPLPELD
jgi:hypothetical protein